MKIFGISWDNFCGGQDTGRETEMVQTGCQWWVQEEVEINRKSIGEG